MALPINSSRNFNQSGIEGWHTRMLLLNSGYTSATGTDTYLFNEYAQGQGKGTFTKGNNTFPPGYWVESEGRVVRVKGSFLFSCDGTTDPFNIATIFSDIGSTYTFTAQQNDNNNHQFASGQNKTNVPVFFEFNLCHSQTGYFTWAGYYKYEFENYSTGGDNTTKAFVPVVKTNTAWGGNLVTDTTKIEVLITAGNLLLQYITIEELG